MSHSEYDYKVFGSGTRLIVTDGKDVTLPKVSVYPVSKPQKEQAVLLCQASGMVPDLVRFRWQAKNKNGGNVELRDVDQVEQRDEDSEVRITSMLIVEKNKATNNKFTCFVQHGTTGEQKAEIPTEEDMRKSEPSPPIVDPCPSPKPVQEVEEEIVNIGMFKLNRSLYLFCMTYVILLVKNVLYFCTIFVLLFKKSPASMEFIKAKAR